MSRSKHWAQYLLLGDSLLVLLLSTFQHLCVSLSSFRCVNVGVVIESRLVSGQCETAIVLLLSLQVI